VSSTAHEPGAATLTAELTPSGRGSLTRDPGGAVPPPAEAAERIDRPPRGAQARGLLHLGAAELGAALGPSLAWWRELGGCWRPPSMDRWVEPVEPIRDTPAEMTAECDQLQALGYRRVTPPHFLLKDTPGQE